MLADKPEPSEVPASSILFFKDSLELPDQMG